LIISFKELCLQIVRTNAERGEAIFSDETLIHRLCSILEKIFFHGLKKKGVLIFGVMPKM